MGLRMPWGKHKGVLLENLEAGYIDNVLEWMDSAKSDWMSKRKPRLFDALDAEYQRRVSGKSVSESKAATQGLACPQTAKALLPDFIKQGYKAMSRRLHPDVGGSDAQMVALQELKAALEKLK